MSEGLFSRRFPSFSHIIEEEISNDPDICGFSYYNYCREFPSSISFEKDNNYYRTNWFSKKTLGSFLYQSNSSEKANLFPNKTDSKKNYPFNDKNFKKLTKDKKYKCQFDQSLWLVLQCKKPLQKSSMLFREKGPIKDYAIVWISETNVFVEIAIENKHKGEFIKCLLSDKDLKIQRIKAGIHNVKDFNDADWLLDEVKRKRAFKSKRDIKLVSQLYRKLKDWCFIDEVSN